MLWIKLVVVTSLAYLTISCSTTQPIPEGLPVPECAVAPLPKVYNGEFEPLDDNEPPHVFRVRIETIIKIVERDAILRDCRDRMKGIIEATHQ